ncbi:methyl-CpG-binding domain-containing protein 5-like [Impatiens glandulifera]|uniref:methyl-CpG-binding domain-containing protein 5-like n=1 Tax=Impatiens glandulifera TaxID=253017 RepID=UPI001FB166E4|nr:methyl-CpG-binding domain-containing protein 5-like [Impatiens glandulifera]
MSDPTLPSNSPNRPMSDSPASDGGDPIQEDPLLQSGSFIEPTFKDDHPARNGDVHEAEPSSAQSKRPFKPVSAPERPDWLPEGWGFDFRIRNSGVSAGTYDRYYIDPASNRRLRSKKEVQHYLETGMLKRPADTAENTPLSSSTKSQKGETSASSNTESSDGWSFDKVNVPDEIRWSLTDATNDKWCAISGNEIVPESTTLVWKDYYFLAANQ